MDRSSGHKINDDIVSLNFISDEINLTGFLKIVIQRTAKYTFFQVHILGHKTINFRRLKSYQVSFLTTIR